MNTIKIFLLLGILLLMAPALAGAKYYEIDKEHSDISFKVKHIVISKVRGHFDEFAGSFYFDQESPNSYKVEARIDAASINTGNEKRDAHLRNEDFLDTDKHAEITFVSNEVKLGDDGEFQVAGDLTIYGVTKPVLLDVEFIGKIDDPWGNTRVGFSASTKIDRKNFGLLYNQALETGGLVVGNEVEISIEIEGILKN